MKNLTPFYRVNFSIDKNVIDTFNSLTQKGARSKIIEGMLRNFINERAPTKGPSFLNLP